MKLPFLSNLAVTPCSIVLEQDGLDENGNAVNDVTWTGNVIYTETSKKYINPDNVVVTITGQLLLQGDIAPGKNISSGKATISTRVYQVYSCTRNRNPDGTVHSTYLELM